MTRPSALVTGASSGIGRACALALASSGLRVFAVVRRPDDANTLALDSAGRVEPLLADVTDLESLERAAKRVEQAVGEAGLDALIGCAGAATGGPLELVDPVRAREVLDVNLVGGMFACRAFLPLLRRARGRIVLIGSVLARAPLPFFAAYAASKAGLRALHAALRHELGPLGVDVVLVEPGSVRTPIWKKSLGPAVARFQTAGEAGAAYGAAAAVVERAAWWLARRGVAAELVAERVVRIVRSRRPRSRYTIGIDARVLRALYAALPGALLDRLIAIAGRRLRDARGTDSSQGPP